MRRVLAIVPWIVANPGEEISQVARRFGVSEAELLADLHVVWMVGIPPYTPDALVEVTIESGRVWIYYADFFARPLKLTPDQGLSLLAASDGLLSMTGSDPDGPLARALAKLRAALGGEDTQLVDVDFGFADPDILRVLRHSASEGSEAVIDYFSFNRNEHTSRTIAPWRVIAQQGAWYVQGYCHQAGAERLFRIDRINAAQATGELTTHGPPPGHENSDSSVFSPQEESPLIVLDLAPEAAWVAESYPCQKIESNNDGSSRVTMAISALPWLERLLVRLGPLATVVADESMDGAHEIGASAASRILARYND